MTYTTKTLARTLPNGDYIEATAELRDNSGTLSPGFSVTGSLWAKHPNAHGRTRKRMGLDSDVAGCIHGDILAAFPNLAPIVKMHLADPDGLPMHAKANGWYFYSGGASAYERAMIAKGRDYGYSRLLETSDHERAARALSIDPAELPTGLTRDQFEAFVDSLAQRYADDAAEARRVLESLPDTGA